MRVLRQVEPPIDPGVLLKWVREERFHSMSQAEIDVLRLTAKIGANFNETSLAGAEARWLGSRWSYRHQNQAVVDMDAATRTRYVIDNFGCFTQELLQEKQLIDVELTSTPTTPLLIAAKVWPTEFCIYIVIIRLYQVAIDSEVTGWSDLSAVVLDPTARQSIHEDVIEDTNTARPFLAYLPAIWNDWTLTTSASRLSADEVG